MLFREGEPADVFYVVRRGRVALELYVPARGPMTVETVEAGEVVGWSWLFPPYRWHFDARAVAPVRAIAVDGACLRGKCEDDPALGYELMQRFSAVLLDRLNATRLRLARSLRRRPWPLSRSDSPARRCPSPTSSAPVTRDGRHVDARDRSGDGRPIDPKPGQFAMLSAFGVGEVPISLSGRGRGGSLVHTIKDVGAVTAELCRIGPRRRRSACAGRSDASGRWTFPLGTDVLVVAGGLGMAPLRPAVEGLLRARDSYGRLILLYGARTPGDLLYRASSSGWREAGLEVQLTVDAGDRARGATASESSRSSSRRRVRSRPRGRARLRARGDDPLHGRGARRARHRRTSACTSRSSAT